MIFSSSVPPLVSTGIGLLAAGLFTTLYASLGASQDAGLSRLPEKFPCVKKRLHRWEKRWDLLRSGVFLAAMLSAMGAIALALDAIALESNRSALYTIGIICCAAILFSLLLNVVPRVLSESYADLMSVRLLPLAALTVRILYPLAWPIERLESRLLNWALSGTDEDNRPSPEEEILHLVDQADEEEIENEEREMIKSVFSFGDTIARESMTPRIEIIGLENTLSIGQSCEAIKASPYSRFPVYHETLDNVCGFVHVKDLLRLFRDGQEDIPTGEVAKPLIFVSEELPISELLRQLRTAQEQIAILIDEYGGTAGLITMEDILEELVGEIHDEYDKDPIMMESLPDGSTVLDARMPVDEANQCLNLTIPSSDEYDSLGGYLYHAFGRIPETGESIECGNAIFRIRSASARKIQAVEVSRGKMPTEDN